MPVTPVVEQVLKAMAEANAPALVDLTPEQGRAMYLLSHQDNTREDLYQVEDATAGSVPIRIYRPNADAKACLVFYHGGGWVIGDLNTHDAACRILANASGCVVIATDYRLAPEHPFPAPFDDCYQTLCWVSDNADALGIDKNRIAVGGDSAGGNLAATVSIKARDEAGPAIQHQLLIYPVTDASMSTPSYTDNAEGYMLGRDTMAWFFNHYVSEQHLKDPMVSPLLAEDLKNLPSATVFTAEFDPLRDEGEAFAERLKTAGIDVDLKRFDGQIHGFYTMTDVMPEAREAALIAAANLKKHLS